jgi:hypothetical protein
MSGLPMGKLDVRGVWRALDSALGAIFGAVYAVLILTVSSRSRSSFSTRIWAPIPRSGTPFGPGPAQVDLRSDEGVDDRPTPARRDCPGRPHDPRAQGHLIARPDRPADHSQRAAAAEALIRRLALWL